MMPASCPLLGDWRACQPAQQRGLGHAPPPSRAPRWSLPHFSMHFSLLSERKTSERKKMHSIQLALGRKAHAINKMGLGSNPLSPLGSRVLPLSPQPQPWPVPVLTGVPSCLSVSEAGVPSLYHLNKPNHILRFQKLGVGS